MALTKQENEELKDIVARLENMMDSVHPSLQQNFIDAIAALSCEIDWSNEE